MLLFGRDHPWSRALRGHLLNEFRRDGWRLFNGTYPPNGVLGGSPAFEAANAAIDAIEAAQVAAMTRASSCVSVCVRGCVSLEAAQ